MSFGFSVGDFVAVGAFAWRVYRLCRESSDDFKDLSAEVASLHIVLKEIEEHLSERNLSAEQKTQLSELGKNCHDVLENLTALLDKYESLGTQAQRAWDRMRWGLEDIIAVRSRLVNNTALLTAFNTALTCSSLARMEKKLDKYFAEVRAGMREGSVISTQTIESLSAADNEAWRLLRRELEDIGIPATLITQNRQFIVNWIKEAVESSSLEQRISEERIDISTQADRGLLEVPSSQAPSLDRSRDDSTTTRPEDLITQSVQQEPHLLKQRGRKSNRPLRLRSSYLVFKMFQSDAELHRAAANGNIERIKELLDFGAALGHRTKRGETALHIGTHGGCEAVVRLLLEQGADVDGKDGCGTTALHYAARRGYEGVVRLLLETGADLNGKDYFGDTVLHHAALHGHEAVVRLLLEHGANVAEENDVGQTALRYAVQGGHITLVQLLLEKGADVNGRDILNTTVLHHAALNGYEAVVRLLLEKGLDVHEKRDFGQTALHYAAQGGHKGIVQLLLEKGADVNGRDYRNSTVLQYAALSGHEAAVLLLLDEGLDVHERNKSGETALHHAAQGGHKGVVRLLLGKGAHLNGKDAFGRTALQHAALKGHQAVVQLLLNNCFMRNELSSAP